MGIWLLILLPGILYCSRMFYQSRAHPIIFARRPMLLIVSVIICVLSNVTILPLFLFNDFSDNHKPIMWLLLMTSHNCTIMSFELRTFQILYDLKCNASMANAIWQKAINEEMSPSLWIKCRKYFGSLRFYIFALVVFTMLTLTLPYCVSGSRELSMLTIMTITGLLITANLSF